LLAWARVGSSARPFPATRQPWSPAGPLVPNADAGWIQSGKSQEARLVALAVRAASAVSAAQVEEAGRARICGAVARPSTCRPLRSLTAIPARVAHRTATRDMPWMAVVRPEARAWAAEPEPSGRAEASLCLSSPSPSRSAPMAITANLPNDDCCSNPTEPKLIAKVTPAGVIATFSLSRGAYDRERARVQAAALPSSLLQPR